MRKNINSHQINKYIVQLRCWSNTQAGMHIARWAEISSALVKYGKNKAHLFYEIVMAGMVSWNLHT